MAEVTQLVLSVDSRQVRTASGDLDKFGKAGQRTEKDAARLTRSFRSLSAAAGAVAGSLVAREIIQAADAYKNLNARLQLATKSASEFATAQSEVFRIAQQTRSGLDETARLYESLARSTDALGVSQAEVFGVTETINKAFIVSGTSAADAAGAILQLGQAFASGVLRGDELNSVLERAPALARGIANGLGVTVGQLRALGAEGELTAEKIFRALQKSGTEFDAAFKTVPLTVAGATQQAANSISKLIGVIDQATGATNLLARALSGISRGIDGFANLPKTITLGGLAKDLNNANTELKRLQALKLSPFSQMVPDLDKQLAIAQQKFEAARRTFKIADGRLGAGGEGDQTSAEARRLGLSGPTLTPSAGTPTKPPRSLGGGGSVVNEADEYLKSLRSQFEATADLSVQDTVLRDLQLGRLGKVTAAQEQELIALAKQIDGFKALQDEEQLQAKKTADALTARNRVLDEGRAVYEATRTPVEALADETDKLNKLLQAGAIDWETYSRAIFAAQDQFDAVTDKAKKTGNDLDKFAERAAENIQNALGDELSNVLDGNFDNIGDSFTRVLNRMVAEAIAADLAKAIGLGGSSGGGGFLGDLVKTGISFFSGTPGRAIGGPVSAGGLYQVNERRPELLNLAGKQFLMMGSQGGSVSPNAGGNTQTIQINQNFNVPATVDRRTQQQIANTAGMAVQRAMVRNG